VVVVYRFCRAKPAPVSLYQLVPDGNDIKKTGSEIKREIDKQETDVIIMPRQIKDSRGRKSHIQN
jgi:hypothetical protein